MAHTEEVSRVSKRDDIGSELRQQVELPEPIDICIENSTGHDDIVFIGSETFRIDGKLTIKIFIGKSGQNLRIIGKQPDEPFRQILPAG